ncbi:hypothetical protein RDABS01_030230, partial [Bienertia sinuspersici]
MNQQKHLAKNRPLVSATNTHFRKFPLSLFRAILWIEEGRGQASTPRMRKKTKRKMEYVSWGSKELIEFLHSIGKDTTKALSQYDVTNIINLYVNEQKLVHPNNKRRVLCDDKLYSLFCKKSLFRNKIHELLELHLAENRNDSDDDNFGSSDDNDGDAFAKKQKTFSSEKKIQLKKKAPEVLKSCLVAINAENIKLVYLRKSLVHELLNNLETFENKVVGSFVRVKSDPHDIFQKNSHQLQLVTGVVEVAIAGDTKMSKSLQISGLTDGVRISELSDDNFSEEEIEDLRTRVKDGLLKQPTIGELEQKVVVLHEDITRHWLARELKLLKNLIDRANEKVDEYLDRKKLLESPAEQSRLLSEIPKLIPEKVKPETISDNALDDSPKAADWDWEPFIDSTNVVMTKPEVLSKQDSQAAAETSARSNGEARPFNPEERNQPGTDHYAATNNGRAQFVDSKAETVTVEGNGHIESLNANHVEIPTTEISRERNGNLQPSPIESEKSQVFVILSDDDDDVKKSRKLLGVGPRFQDLNPNRWELRCWDTKSRQWDPDSRWWDPNIRTSIQTVGNSRWRDSKPRQWTQIPGGGTQISGPQSKLFGTPGAGFRVQAMGPRFKVVGPKHQDLNPNCSELQVVDPSIRTSIQTVRKLQVSGFKVQAMGPRFQVVGPKYQTSIQTARNFRCRIQSPGNGIQTPGSGIQVSGSRSKQPVRRYVDPHNKGGNQTPAPHPELLVWHYFDPQQRIQGPFSLTSLKRWNDLRYFPLDFKVWMSGQTPEQG